MQGAEFYDEQFLVGAKGKREIGLDLLGETLHPKEGGGHGF